MTAALTLHLRLDRAALTRLVVAGAAWGLTLAFGLIAMTYVQCGAMPCPDEMVFTTLACVAAGCVTIGPLAAFAK